MKFSQHNGSVLQYNTKPGIAHHTHPLHDRWVDILSEILRLFLLEEFVLLVLVHHNGCQNPSHWDHLNGSGLQIISREEIVNVFGELLLSPCIHDSRIPVFFNYLPQEDVGLHVGLEQRLQLIEFGYSGLNDFFSTFNFFLFDERQYFKTFIEQKLFIECEWLLEEFLLHFLVIQFYFFLHIVVHN